MHNLKKLARILKNHFQKTWRNKLLSAVLVIIGYITTIPDGDATGAIFLLFLAIPFFFMKKDFAEYNEK